MKSRLLIIWFLFGWMSSTNQEYIKENERNTTTPTTNNGNNFFIQRPFHSPPTVRPPPYFNSFKSCSVANEIENWEGNLCGDLNTGEIPANPLGQFQFDGVSQYPFEAIKNKTLDFFRHALPILKTYKSLPKVARYGRTDSLLPLSLLNRRTRPRRNAEFDEGTAVDHQGRMLPFGSTRVKRTQAQFFPHSHSYRQNNGNNMCENAIFCKFLNTMYDKLPQGFQRLVSAETHKKLSHQLLQQLKSNIGGGGMTGATKHPELLALASDLAQGPVVEDRNIPQTPCPSTAEYLTPVFARNHEGAWRYVVQIPREGYFTQTVEVTKCIKTNCYYMDGTCLTSPRWQSLLVAEIFYPDAAFPLNSDTMVDSHPANHHRSSRSTTKHRQGDVSQGGEFYGRDENGSRLKVNHLHEQETTQSNQTSQCDGYDEIGCYQFRLFYDWFLIPGECKCWKKRFSSLYSTIPHNAQN